MFTGFMRTRPSATGWAWFYVGLYFLQSGWPAWAANVAGAIFFLRTRRLAGAEDSAEIFAIGVVTFLIGVAILSVGRRIERTLELLNWVLVTIILGGFFVLGAAFVPIETWLAGLTGLAGFDLSHRHRVDGEPTAARGADRRRTRAL